MAKRQTTGMPRKNRRRDSDEVESQGWFDDLLGNPRTRQEREDAINQLIIRSTVAIIGVIVALIALALAWEFLVVPTRAVATVNGERITVREFRQRMNFERAYVAQLANTRYSQLQQQAAQFGMDVNQFVENDQQLQQWSRELQVDDVLGQRVINDMVDDVLIRQAAEERNVTVDDERIQNEINDFFGYDPTQVALIGTDPTATPEPSATPEPYVSPTPSPTPLPTSTPVPTEVPETTPEAVAEVTAEATAEVTDVVEAPTLAPSPTPSQEERRETFEETVDLFRQNLRETGNIGNSLIDAFFEREALRQALLEDVVGDSEETTFVNARHILVSTEEEATEIIDLLNSGAPFTELAKARSEDTGSGARGGELGWSPAANYVGPFQDAVLEAPVGDIVGPVETEFGFHIIQVRAREERDVEGAQLEQIRQQEFAVWLEEYREQNEENISINDNWPDFIN